MAFRYYSQSFSALIFLTLRPWSQVFKTGKNCFYSYWRWFPLINWNLNFCWRKYLPINHGSDLLPFFCLRDLLTFETKTKWKWKLSKQKKRLIDLSKFSFLLFLIEVDDSLQQQQQKLNRNEILNKPWFPKNQKFSSLLYEDNLNTFIILLLCLYQLVKTT